MGQLFPIRRSFLKTFLLAVLLTCARSTLGAQTQTAASKPLNLNINGLLVFEINANQGISGFRALLDRQQKEYGAPLGGKTSTKVYLAIDPFDLYSVRMNFDNCGNGALYPKFRGPENQCTFTETYIPPTQTVTLGDWVTVFSVTLTDKCVQKVRRLEIQFR